MITILWNSFSHSKTNDFRKFQKTRDIKYTLHKALLTILSLVCIYGWMKQDKEVTYHLSFCSNPECCCIHIHHHIMIIYDLTACFSLVSLFFTQLCGSFFFFLPSVRCVCDLKPLAVSIDKTVLMFGVVKSRRFCECIFNNRLLHFWDKKVEGFKKCSFANVKNHYMQFPKWKRKVIFFLLFFFFVSHGNQLWLQDKNGGWHGSVYLLWNISSHCFSSG